MISVVFPTRNRAELLDAALRSVAEQRLDPESFEVLVIDNGSTDQTREIAEHWTSQRPSIRYLHEAEPGLHAGRHRGLAEARGDILVFADDDIEAQPSWLQTLADVFSDPDVAMAGGNNLPLFLQTPPPWLESLWNRRAKNGSRSLPALSIQEWPEGRYPISPYQIWGCNFAIRKSVLLAAGGFHPDGMPKELIRFRGDGETHVSRYVAEKGLKCLYDSGATVYHKVTLERMTLAYFHQRGFNQGVSDSYTQLRGETIQPATPRSVAYRAARLGWHRLRQMSIRSPADREASRVVEAQRIGHREGFTFHQAAYRDDPVVKTWVHREHYF
ncbi:glycosyltransferase [Cyanobium sp. FGCU-6]|nr:glycosyltransferase [Cyanobium sp. FGCU6]